VYGKKEGEGGEGIGGNSALIVKNNNNSDYN